MAKEYFAKEEDIDILRDNINKKISSPNVAEVGQILSVKAVDDSGKPTEWEVVNKPGSGPGESSPYIYMTQEEYEALTEYEQDKMYWVTYPCGDWLVWQNGEAILGQGVAQPWGLVLPGKYFTYSIFTGKRIAVAFKPEYKLSNDEYLRPNLEVVNIAKGVESIGQGAFAHTINLRSISLPNSIKEIGASAFQDCSALQNVAIPDGVTIIDSYAFTNCSALTSLIIPEGVVKTGSYAFQNCTAIECIIFQGDSNTLPIEIYDYTFEENSSLVNIIGDRELKIGGGRAFHNCSSLKTVQCPIYIYSGSYSFANCSSLEDVILSEKSTKIPDSGFASTNLKNMNIPNSVSSIGENAFYSCKALTSVTIGNGITSINTYAFNGCTALKTITINKPSGSISGAPWGATKATVVWTG